MEWTMKRGYVCKQCDFVSVVYVRINYSTSPIAIPREIEVSVPRAFYNFPSVPQVDIIWEPLV